MYCGVGVGSGKELATYYALITKAFYMFAHMGILNFPCARLPAAGCVCNVDMTDAVDISTEGISQITLVDLHVIGIIKKLELGGADQPHQLCPHFGGG